MNLKKIMGILAVPFALGMLASCGETSSNSTSEEGSTSKPGTSSTTETTTTDPETGIIKEATEINIWTIVGDNNVATLNGYIEAFKKIEPNVTVKHTKQTGMGYNELKDAVTKGFTSNNYPDMVQAYPDHVAEYIDYGKALNMTQYIENAQYGLTQEDKDDYVTAYLEEGANYIQKGYYSLPFQKSTEAMFYNEDVLLNSTVAQGIVDQDRTINAGKPINATYLNNLTWEELFNKLCPAIIKYNDSLAEDEKILKSDQLYHAVFAYDSDDNLFITTAAQYEAPYTSVNTTTNKGSADFNNAETKAIAKMFNKAANNGYIISKGSAAGNYTNTYFTARNTLFSVGSTGGVKYQFSKDNPMNVGVANIPHAEGHPAKVISQGPSLAFLNHKDSNKALASWLFYKFMTNKENALDWCLETGYQAIRKSSYLSEDYLAKTDVESTTEKTLERVMAKSLGYVTGVNEQLFTSPAFVGSSACRNAAGGLMTKFLTKTGTLLTDEEINGAFIEAYNTATIAIK